LLIFLTTIAAGALAEGARTLVLAGRPHTAVLYNAYLRARRVLETFRSTSPDNTTEPILDSRNPYLRERQEFETLLPLFKSIDAGIGNTDFYDLVSQNAAININDGDCTRMKPNIRKRTMQLRTRLFYPYDPPTVFYDADRPLPDPIDRFLKKYQFRTVTVTTNAYGERLTFPVVDKREKVLVAGDSVALGLSIDDHETLASRLQAADPSRQYVNLGISGIGPRQIACALDAAADRYKGQIAEVVYVFCDNDYDASDPRANGQAVVSWLKSYGERNGVQRGTIVRAPYLEVLFPIAADSKQDDFNIASARPLARVSSEAGFRYLDIADLALQEEAETGSLFAPFRLFVDHVHWSSYGTTKVASALLNYRR